MLKCPVYWTYNSASSLLQPAALFNTNSHLYWAVVSPENKHNILIHIMDKNSCIGTQVYSKKLKGHSAIICSLSLNKSNNNDNTIILLSACSDYLILWYISLIENTIESTYFYLETRLQPSDHSNLVTNIYFNNSNSVLLLLAGTKILVYKLHQNQLSFNAILEGHILPVISVEYISTNFDIIVSISLDRTFCVWDLKTLSCMYTSSLITSFPLLSLDTLLISHLKSLFLIVSSDATLRLYEWCHSSNTSYLTLELDLRILLLYRCDRSRNDLDECTRLSCKESNLLKSENRVENQVNEVGVTNFSETNILCCKLITTQLDILNDKDNTATPRRIRYLIIVLTNCYIFFIDYLNGDVIERVDLRERLTNPLGEFNELTTGYITVSHCTEQTAALYLLATLNDESQILFSYDFIISGSITYSELREASATQVTSNQSLEEKSFASANPQHNVLTCEKTGNKSNIKKKTRTSLNKPITFHSKVKSSGYTSAPSSNMFTGTHVSKAKLKISNRHINEASKLVKIKSDPTNKDSYLTNYSFSDKQLFTMKISGPSASIQCISPNCSGDKLACGIIDGSVLFISDSDLKPKTVSLSSKLKSKCIIASESPIMCMDWSSCRNDLLLVSTKTECSLWNPNNLCYFRISKSYFPQNDSILSVQYFSLDKYILVTHGESISLFNYHLNKKCDKLQDEIRTYSNTNGTFSLYKSIRVASHPFKVVASSVSNEFYSSMAIIASSNRSLYLYDINTHQRMLAYPSLESLAYSIHQCPASHYNYASISDYNLFITSSLKSCINVWDLRYDKKLFNFRMHKNTLMPLSSKISPCGRYIATGSEDKAVYFYDIRMPSRLFSRKIIGFSDCVTQLGFKPNVPGIFTATLDNVVTIY